jgi:hypothetical protein
MRTTIRLDPHLLKDAKKHAASTHRTLTAVIEDALREVLVRARSVPPPVDLPASPHRGGLMPGIDLTSSGALWDALDDADHDRHHGSR